MRRFFGYSRIERGATAVEYGLILALVFLAMIGALIERRQRHHRDVELRLRSGDRRLTQVRVKRLETSPS